MKIRNKGFLGFLVTAFLVTACNTTPSPVGVDNKSNSPVSQGIQNYENGRIKINNNSDSLKDRIIYKNNLVNIKPRNGFQTQAEPDFKIRQVADVKPFQVHGDTVQAANIFLSENGKTAYVAYDIAGTKFGGGVQIIDVTDPYHPVMKAEMTLNDTDIYDLTQKDNKLYLAGASQAEDMPPAFLEVFSLTDPVQFDKSMKKVAVKSYAATGVELYKDKILVTSGDKGGVLSEVNSSTYNVDKTFDVNDARGVDVEGDNVGVIGATPGKLATFKDSASVSEYNIPGATIPVSQSTIQLDGDLAYMAAGNGGFVVMDYKTGEQKFNFKPEQGITNGVSYSNGRAFLANGEDGISVMEKAGDTNFTELGKLEFDGPYSSNVVVSKGCMLFTATGLGGLTISVIEDSKTGESCYKNPNPEPTASPTVEPTVAPTVAPTPSATPVPTPPPTSCSNNEGFIGWYVYDNKTPYETVSNTNFKVDFHGDPDLFYYEPSGGKGLMDPTQNKQEAFGKIEKYILNNVDKMKTEATFSYDTSSTLDTFKQGTYTYALSYMYVPEDDKSKYTLEVGSVDDAISVMVNGKIVGNMKLGESNKTFNLGTTADGQATLKACRNTVIIILADDSKVEKFIRGVKFLRDGKQINQLDPKQLEN